ncbi:acyl-CoA dehydrogenase family protein [Brevibacterium jeotgali]|uniref:Putative acyl-CoA dehydrogenase n=1 Tax=Brevibacterium jeotgali TaxID=1262550 RepID=A0A2H1L6Z8_9MICO|nr:acyl-CoA dehydrogenase family protein [Brevibacterium jeotgali]TWC02299.1 putative acyl-CoA dehydrogenase [Brevibacterium jeotgali]SMY12649.1 putative acyl-CoA dehydrogenase [Brevibacterium jeotgali]
MTHTVLNQSAPRIDVDEYTSNTALVDAVTALAPQADADELGRIGRLVGSESFQRDAAVAHRITPQLSTHDRWGHRVDDVEFHPGYHRIIDDALSAGAHSHAWAHPGPGANVERAARFMLFSQIEPGHACPVSMTHSAAAALQDTPHAEFWLPRLLETTYDPRLVDAHDKRAVTFGMAMTEKQGGSDVRANTTRAVPATGASGIEAAGTSAADTPLGFGGVTGGHCLLTGHKWFCSAPQSDAFLVLAQLEEGVSCFLVPRILPGGERNPFRIQRLKDKLGNRSNASSEIELEDTHGWLVGEPGRGVRTIIEMVNRTRLDCILGSTAGMRQGVAEAVWHAQHRSAFGARLVDQPLMRSVLADLQLEAEAAVWTAIHLARAHDDESADTADFRRIATAVAKYWICKRGPEHAYESLECLGGNGYTEDFPLAMRYREQPVMAVWEGSGNVIVLDVIRAMAKDPASAKAFLAYVETGLGRVDAYDRAVERLSADLTAAGQVVAGGDAGAVARLQSSGRVLVERMALLLQAAVLVEHAPAEVAESFVHARIGEDRGREYGALPDGVAIDLLVERAAG